MSSVKDLQNKMEKALDHIKKELSTIRTGRANPDLLSKIQVEYYGSYVPLNQVASVTVPENMMLVLNVFDRSVVKAVEKAITSSDLNLNPLTEGSVIRLRLPELTEDRRKELVKVVRTRAEDGKIALRNLRRDFIEELKKQLKNKEITEDDHKRGQDEAQKLTEKYTHQIEASVAQKEAEIMKV